MDPWVRAWHDSVPPQQAWDKLSECSAASGSVVRFTPHMWLAEAVHIGDHLDRWKLYDPIASHVFIWTDHLEQRIRLYLFSMFQCWNGPNKQTAHQKILFRLISALRTPLWYYIILISAAKQFSSSAQLKQELDWTFQPKQLPWDSSWSP